MQLANTSQKLPFDRTNKTHAALAKLGREAEIAMEGLTVDEALHFSATRRRFRESLGQAAPMQKISEIVFEMLS